MRSRERDVSVVARRDRDFVHETSSSNPGKGRKKFSRSWSWPRLTSGKYGRRCLLKKKWMSGCRARSWSRDAFEVKSVADFRSARDELPGRSISLDGDAATEREDAACSETNRDRLTVTKNPSRHCCCPFSSMNRADIRSVKRESGYPYQSRRMIVKLGGRTKKNVCVFGSVNGAQCIRGRDLSSLLFPLNKHGAVATGPRSDSVLCTGKHM